MRILVATDGSDTAHRAVDLAARLTKELKGHLKIIHVISLHDAIREHARSADALVAFSEETLTIARRRAEELGVSDGRLESRTGDVAESIIDVARQDQIDIIVLGRRGLGRLSGLLLGSVSQKIVSLAPCAVIVVP